MSEIYLSSLNKIKSLYNKLSDNEKLKNEIMNCILFENTKVLIVDGDIDKVNYIIENNSMIKERIVSKDDNHIEFTNGSRIDIRDSTEVVSIKGNTSNHVYFLDNEYFDNVIKSFNYAKENL